MEDLKIRNLRNKTEIDGLTYCMGENEAFTGIFVEKAENNSERHEIKETYDKGIIVKRMVNYLKKKYLNIINMVYLKKKLSQMGKFHITLIKRKRKKLILKHTKNIILLKKL